MAHVTRRFKRPCCRALSTGTLLHFHSNIKDSTTSREQGDTDGAAGACVGVARSLVLNLLLLNAVPRGAGPASACAAALAGGLGVGKEKQSN